MLPPKQTSAGSDSGRARKMLAYGRWLIRKRSVGFGVTWPWWGLRTVFGMADIRKDSIVVGEQEKDVARDAEPVSLAAAG
jgi:hypothetical protein